MHRIPFHKVPGRALLRTAVLGVGFMALVAVGGSTAASYGVFVPVDAAAAQVSAAPSSGNTSGWSSARYANCAEVRDAGKAPLRRGEPGYRIGLDRDGDGWACDQNGRGGDRDRDRDGDDGRDGKDGKDGKDGRDGKTRTVYVTQYVKSYLDRGGDRSRVNDGGQVAIYPSGGVATGA